MALKLVFQLERIPHVDLHDNLKRLLEKGVLMLDLCVCLDLLHFV